MTITVRAVAAEIVAAAALLALVMLIYVAMLGISGTGADGAPGPTVILLATVVVALVVRPAHHRMRTTLRRRWGVQTLSPVDVLRRLTHGGDGRPAAIGSDGLPMHMVTVLHRALQTARAELWIVVEGEPRLEASLPTSAIPGSPTTTLSTTHPAVHPIRRGDETVGYLRLEPAAGREFSTTEQRLLAAYSSQAGQLLALIARQQGLRTRENELTDRAAALRRSRVHLLDAARIERRRVERDLHDGAQQQLIALGLSVQLARQLAVRSPDRARAVLTQAAERARGAGHELGRLTESLYPAVLREGTLSAAMRQAADRAGTPVAIEVVPPHADSSLDPDSRDALFFVVSEAVQNAVKHGRAERMSVLIERTPTALVVRIVDDGEGFAADIARPGEGVRNMRRRLADLGGEVDFASAPGSGTTVTASVPLGSHQA